MDLDDTQEELKSHFESSYTEGVVRGVFFASDAIADLYKKRVIITVEELNMAITALKRLMDEKFNTDFTDEENS